MHKYANLIMMCLWMIVCLTENNSAQSDIPKQVQCLTQPALAFDEKLIPKLGKEWYVARATLRTLLRKGLPEPTMNNCTPMTYFDTCQGAIYIEREWSKDGENVKKMTKAYSKQYDDIAEYWEDQLRVDPYYFVWKSTGTSMTLHFKDGNYKEVKLSEVPVVENALARMYALAAYGFLLDTGEVDWALYLDCDEDFAWIEIPKFVIEDQKLLDMVNANIDEYLQEPRNPLIVPQMVKLKTELPF